MTVDVEQICTHADLLNEIGSTRELDRLIPKEDAGDTSRFRQLAAEEAIKALGRRSPPVYLADLLDLTELRDLVAYGAAMRLYRLALTGAADSDAQMAKFKHYRDAFDAELDALAPTVSDGGRGATSAVSVSRR